MPEPRSLAFFDLPSPDGPQKGAGAAEERGVVAAFEWLTKRVHLPLIEQTVAVLQQPHFACDVSLSCDANVIGTKNVPIVRIYARTGDTRTLVGRGRLGGDGPGTIAQIAASTVFNRHVASARVGAVTYEVTLQFEQGPGGVAPSAFTEEMILSVVGHNFGHNVPLAKPRRVHYGPAKLAALGTTGLVETTLDCELLGITGINNETAATRWLQVFDLNQALAGNEIAVEEVRVPPGSNFTIDYSELPRELGAGLVLGVSTTPGTFTAQATTTGWSLSLAYR